MADMSRYRRATSGSTFFFTVVAFRRRPILCDPLVVAALRTAIQAVRRRRPFAIDAWVQLPDHLHCIWTLPADDTDFSQRWSEIKRPVSHACRHSYDDVVLSPSMKRQGVASIWQRRFWEHRVRNDEDFRLHLDYIHINPVRHGLVEHASLWKFSSFSKCVREGWYAQDWAGPVVMPELKWE